MLKNFLDSFGDSRTAATNNLLFPFAMLG